MLKTILIVAVVAVALLLVYAATRPDTFRVERSLRIKAGPEAIFPLINDLHGFNTWNPYLKKDPAMKQDYGGAASGPGASYAWESSKVGAGSMTIEAATPERITVRLEFLKPFKASNKAEFTLRPEGDATIVTWSMEGRANFVSKLMQLFFSMDNMVGKDFADGLASLAVLVEKR